MLLTLKYQHIPPNLHFKNPNPNIPALHDGSFKVVDKVTPFCGDTIAVSSFGFGGANVHVVIKKVQEPVNVMSSVKDEISCKVDGTTNSSLTSSSTTSGYRGNETSQSDGHYLLNVQHVSNSHLAAEVGRKTSSKSLKYQSSDLTPPAKTENENILPSKLVVISARTEDSAQNLLQLAANHCDEDETLALLDAQINVLPAVFPARGYATITGDKIVKQVQVGDA